MTSAPTSKQVDLDRLLALRLVVARFGEMDLAKWWNSTGQLGQLGASVLHRGFPRTHHFAQARSVFAVAAARCEAVFDPPRSVTLWKMPEEIEEEFDARWEHWIDDAAVWQPFFRNLAVIKSTDLLHVLRSFALVDDRAEDLLSKLRRSAEGRAVPIPHIFSSTDDDVTLMALAFARGEPGSLAVPYARRSDR